MRIECVSVEDARELLDIYRYYVEDTAVSFEYEVPTQEEFENRIRTISAKYPYIKAIDEDGTILGYAYCGTFKGRSAYDWSAETTIYLSKERRGKGIGRLLYEELENRAREMGLLNLNACIAVTNREDEHLTNGSMYFHEKMGYTKVGVFHNSGYKFHAWYDMIWMEKMIGEHTAEPKAVEWGRKSHISTYLK